MAGKAFPESKEIQLRTMKERLQKGLTDQLLTHKCKRQVMCNPEISIKELEKLSVRWSPHQETVQAVLL